MLKAIFLLVLSLFLSGCASLIPHPASTARPVQIESAPFVLNGRIAINYQGARHSAGLRWNHQAQTDEILLLTPLGQTVARITRDAQQATLEQGGKQYQAADIETLMTQMLGWYLPLNELHYWVLGLAATNSPAKIERNSDNQINLLQQDGWTVQYDHADTTPDGLPSHLQLSHEDLQARLLIDDWEWGSK